MPTKIAKFDPDAAASSDSGLFGLSSSPEEAGLVVIPVPFEATTSYGGGTSRAPRAILAASRQVDLLDRDFGPIWKRGIAMLPVPADIEKLSKTAKATATPVIRAGGASTPAHRRALATVNAAGDRVNAWVRARAVEILDRGALPAVLGGDHAAPYGLIEELARRHPGMGILHVDAHADLREAYEGFTWSHASIHHGTMTRLRQVSRIVQVGLRDVGEAEVRMAERSKGRIIQHHESDLRSEMFRGLTWDVACRRIVDDLPGSVHVSFDIDGLSPDLCPHTGTPVPGGLSFAEAVHLLRVLASSGRRVVGFDLCEVVPGPRGDEWDAAVGARMLYKLAGCALSTAGGRAIRTRLRT